MKTINKVLGSLYEDEEQIKAAEFITLLLAENAAKGVTSTLDKYLNLFTGVGVVVTVLIPGEDDVFLMSTYAGLREMLEPGPGSLVENMARRVDLLPEDLRGPSGEKLLIKRLISHYQEYLSKAEIPAQDPPVVKQSATPKSFWEG